MPVRHSTATHQQAISHDFLKSCSVVASFPEGTSVTINVFFTVVMLSVENDTGDTTVDKPVVGRGWLLEASRRFISELYRWPPSPDLTLPTA